MADVQTEDKPGEKEANKPNSPKPDQDEVAPPLISTTKREFSNQTKPKRPSAYHYDTFKKLAPYPVVSDWLKTL